MLQDCYGAIFLANPGLQLRQPCLVTWTIKKIIRGPHLLERLFLNLESTLQVAQAGEGGSEQVHEPGIVRLLAQKAIHFLAALGVTGFCAGHVPAQSLKRAKERKVFRSEARRV